MADDNPKMIYLAPQCCADPNEGRLWCQDDVWECECGVEAPHRGIKYVRADVVAKIIAETVVELDKMATGLRHGH
jgi:hypothetical protein